MIVSAPISDPLAIPVKKRENFLRATLEGECLFEGEHVKNLISGVLLYVYDIYSFWCCVLDNLIIMGLLHTMLNFWLISWFKLMDVFNTLVYLYKFLFSLSLLFIYLSFVAEYLLFCHALL